MYTNLGAFTVNPDKYQEGYDKYNQANPRQRSLAEATVIEDTFIYPVPTYKRDPVKPAKKGQKFQISSISTYQKMPTFFKIVESQGGGYLPVNSVSVDNAKVRLLNKTEAKEDPTRELPSTPTKDQKDKIKQEAERSTGKILKSAFNPKTTGGLVLTAFAVGIGAYFFMRGK